MQEIIISGLHGLYGLKPVIGNPFAKATANGIHFAVTTYEVTDFGHLCVIEMKAIFGVMKMESVILTARNKDLPLYCADLIRSAGNHTLLHTFYNTAACPMSEEEKKPYRRAKERFAALRPYRETPYGDASLRYDFSLGVTGKAVKEKERTITQAYFDAYLENIASAPYCDAEEKREKTAAYAERLFRSGSPGTDQFVKMIGEEAAKDMFEKYVFCCR